MSSDSFHILPLLEGDFWLIVPVSMVAANLYYNIETLMVTSKLNYLRARGPLIVEYLVERGFSRSRGRIVDVQSDIDPKIWNKDLLD